MAATRRARQGPLRTVRRDCAVAAGPRGHPPVPLSYEDLPLLPSVRRSRRGELKGIRSRTAIWQLVTGLCSEALTYACAHDRRVDADRFEHTSTHWLRHTYAKRLARAVRDGPDASAALENMGHSDRRIFRQYVDDEPLKRACDAAGPCTCDTVTVSVPRLPGAATPLNSPRRYDRRSQHCRCDGPSRRSLAHAPPQCAAELHARHELSLTDVPRRSRIRRSPRMLEKLLPVQLASALQITEALRRGQPVYRTAARSGLRTEIVSLLRERVDRRVAGLGCGQVGSTASGRREVLVRRYLSPQ